MRKQSTRKFNSVYGLSKEQVIIETILKSSFNARSRSSIKKVDEGILDFIKGLFTSVLSLFGVELDNATQTYETQTTDFISNEVEQDVSGGQVSREDLGLSKDTKDEKIKWTAIKPQTDKGREYVKKVAVKTSKEILSGAAAKIQELEGVPAFPSQKNVNERCKSDAVWKLLMEDAAAAKDAAATQAMAEEMEKYQPQVNSALEGVGMMKGFAMSLKNAIPEFEEVENTVKPVTPGDVAQLASVIAQKLSDAGVEG